MTAAEVDKPNRITLAGLAPLAYWVAWQAQGRTDGTSVTKVPYSPGAKRKAMANKPETWGTRGQAEVRAACLPKPHGIGGVGLELGPLPDGRHLCGIDLDSCRNPDTGVIESWAQAIIDRLASYTEVSPSRTGVKIFCLHADAERAVLRAALGTAPTGELKHGACWKRKTDVAHPPAIEVHLSNRFFAVTDQILEGSTDELREMSAAVLLQIMRVDGPALVRSVGSAVASVGSPSEPGALAQTTAVRPPGSDRSRSAIAFKVGAAARRRGATYQAMCDEVRDNPDTAAWYAEKGTANDNRELRRVWDNTAPDAVTSVQHWLLACQRNEKGEPLGNIANAMIAMRRDEKLHHVFAYDEMLRGGLVVGPLPGDNPSDGKESRPIRDVDVSQVQEYLQLSGLPRLGKDTTHQAVDLRASERAFHPLRDYLNELKWDGTKRVRSWLIDYMGATDSPYVQGIGMLFLVCMVARGFEAGCKADYMLILEGPQGIRKSTACEVLAGNWYSDDLPDLRSGGKDIAQHLNGKWLIEVGEMSAMTQADAAALKAFITRTVERYRPSYGRKEVVEPRQVVFVGTTNKTAYLRDETGGRRFWPVSVTWCDTDRLAADRNQLFAEAVALYREGQQWWPTEAFEAMHIKPQQEARYEADAWEGQIGAYLQVKVEDAAKPDGKAARLTVLDVAREALRFDIPKLGVAEQRRIAAAMERLGWGRAARGGNGERFWTPLYMQ